MDIKNKVAVVTGVSKGIGLAVVEALLDRGVKVAGWGRTAPEIKHANFLFCPCDVRQEASVEEAYRQTVAAYGDDVHILVNNAGLGMSAPFEELKPEDWRLMFDTNVHGIFYCTRLLVAKMKALGEGHIINISSIAGLMGSENNAGYCATKFAVRGMSQALYKEVRDYGVKVTCIYPGSVDTPFFDNFSNVTNRENMMQPADIASTILHALQSSPNYHHVDIEVRPLMPKGRKKL